MSDKTLKPDFSHRLSLGGTLENQLVDSVYLITGKLLAKLELFTDATRTVAVLTARITWKASRTR